MYPYLSCRYFRAVICSVCVMLLLLKQLHKKGASKIKRDACSAHAYQSMHCAACILILLAPCTTSCPAVAEVLTVCRDATSTAEPSNNGSTTASPGHSRSSRPVPSDPDIAQVLRQVQLGPLLDRVTSDGGLGLDTTADWASILSLGEQQRLAFARYIWTSMLASGCLDRRTKHRSLCTIKLMPVPAVLYCPMQGYRTKQMYQQTVTCAAVSVCHGMHTCLPQPATSVYALQDHYVKTQAGYHGRGYQCS